MGVGLGFFISIPIGKDLWREEEGISLSFILLYYIISYYIKFVHINTGSSGLLLSVLVRCFIYLCLYLSILQLSDNYFPNSHIVNNTAIKNFKHVYVYIFSLHK